MRKCTSSCQINAIALLVGGVDWSLAHQILRLFLAFNWARIMLGLGLVLGLG